MGNRISQIIIQLLGSRIAPTVALLVVGPGADFAQWSSPKPAPPSPSSQSTRLVAGHRDIVDSHCWTVVEIVQSSVIVGGGVFLIVVVGGRWLERL